jgi:hypothetical protein
MPTLFKLIQRFNKFLSKSQHYFADIDIILKFIRKDRGTFITKIILKSKTKVIGISLLMLKTLYSYNNQDGIILTKGCNQSSMKQNKETD